MDPKDLNTQEDQEEALLNIKLSKILYKLEEVVKAAQSTKVKLKAVKKKK